MCALVLYISRELCLPEVLEARRRPALVERLRLAELVDDPAPELPVEIVADPYDRLLQLLRRDVGQPHLAAREGGDVGDAVAHLSGADDSDAFDHLTIVPYELALTRSEEHPSELQSLMRISYAV